MGRSALLPTCRRGLVLRVVFDRWVMSIFPRPGLVVVEKPNQIAVRYPPPFADIDSSKFTVLDPATDRRVVDLQPVGHFMNGLILIVGHRIASYAETSCRIDELSLFGLIWVKWCVARTCFFLRT